MRRVTRSDLLQVPALGLGVAVSTGLSGCAGSSSSFRGCKVGFRHGNGAHRRAGHPPANQRGYLLVTFTATEARADWRCVSTVKAREYSPDASRARSLIVQAGSNVLSDVVWVHRLEYGGTAPDQTR